MPGHDCGDGGTSGCVSCPFCTGVGTLIKPPPKRRKPRKKKKEERKTPKSDEDEGAPLF